MYKHILVPTDGSKLSLRAAKEAATLARSLKAKITAVYVMEPFMPTIPAEGTVFHRSVANDQSAHRASSAKVANAALAKVQAAAAAEKVACEVVTMIGSEPWQGIIKTAKQKKCDVIVMGSHGRGVIAGALLGSETGKVLSHSKTPVLVCR